MAWGVPARLAQLRPVRASVNCGEAIMSTDVPSADRQADRATGAVLGLAVGDALGATLQFTPRADCPHHTEMTGGGPFHLPAGAWTDDTAMAVAMARSMLERGEFDARHVMDSFLAWFKRGEHSCTATCFDIGNTTRDALSHYEMTGNPLAGDVSPHRAGNGSLMRIAPVALATFGNPRAADAMARLSSRTTHGAPQAVDACALFVALLQEAIAGSDALAPRTIEAHPEVAAVAAGSWPGKPREAIAASGDVVRTLEAALWCAGSAPTFEEALVLAVNLGEDSDTVGAVTGQLAGAMHGASAIPQRWLAPLAWRETLEALSRDLWRASPGAGPAG
jgi:ADP-ribosyl-[dinitrogen reductase] hydrolase